MNATSPALDEAPPDWGAYAAVMADYSEDCNRWRRRTWWECRECAHNPCECADLWATIFPRISEEE